MGPIQAKISSYPAQGADPAVLAVGATPRGVIRTLRVMAGGAPPSSFTYALYCAAAAFVPDADGNPTAALAEGSEQYRVTPDIVTTGEVVAPAGFGLAYAYQNLDGTGPTNRLSYLYLRVAGLGTTAGPAVILTVEGSNLN